ncbi:MAG: nickel pincer cofactor biosynthesis protein LarC [Gemmatimonadetes bacterium]|jgi:pyridinium-3,5-bisthiocarboxylic acid mononucleotide nickel chelatase|nr:nickel pincer cofactor biosynthesis protein LarC [Gemmatimonadota bacterium]MBT6147957.1 nickel pincer cofactor biosynthesis protein LarC [Gemmatimonadota bacterium]MBT7862100.1 nickel pincer cofactor biosynthesis protein LarC [Gemmatimonadota bacterium]
MIAYFDCQSGASGDMILGALVDAGLPLDQLQRHINALDIGAVLQHERVMRCGVSASRIQVQIEGHTIQPSEEHHLSADVISGRAADVGHTHDHDHHSHDHAHDGAHAAHGEHSHTKVTSILDRIQASALEEEIKTTACRIYERLAEAEATVHGADVETVGLHEVGSLDALVDIVGAVAGLRDLGVTDIYCSPLHCGSGTVRCAHGRYPVPAPGVVALCRDIPMVQTDVPAELLTPTGAAILTTLASGYGRDCPPLTLRNTGYGAGGRDLEGRPNVLRIRLGEVATEDGRDHCVLLEANLDDMNPEIFSFLFDRLLTAGARDVFVTPILMKKGRPGHLLSVLGDTDQVDELAQIVLAETTTLGIRTHEVARRTLPRSWQTVTTDFGDVRVKVTQISGHKRGAPEYEDCARLAREKGVPMLTVYTAAAVAWAASEPTT